MLSAHVESLGDVLAAWEVRRHDAPFFCPSCHEQVILHQGRIMTAHFAHRAKSACPASRYGETEAHRQAIKGLSFALRADAEVIDVEVQPVLRGIVPDLRITLAGGQQVGIEIQRAAVTVNEITRRTKQYHWLRLPVLWIALGRWHTREDEIFSANAWQRWAHALYFGRCYYLHSGATVVPVHFGPEWTADGAYAKYWRRPEPGPVADIARDFREIVRAGWSSERIEIPAATIWHAPAPRWWD